MPPKAAWLVALMANRWFRTFIAGAGFFADSYSLFVTDGVTNILKNLGPVVSVPYKYTDGTGNHTMKNYFNVLCYTKDEKCLPKIYSASAGGWIDNPDSIYDEEMIPLYQTQTTELKNGVNNAALIGSVLGQIFFGLCGDLIGRKWSFVVTSTLIILGALGSATSAAGMTAQGNLNALGMWADANPSVPNSMYNVYTQLYVWRGILGFGVGGEYPLASTITSESATAAQRGLAVLSIFSMQGFGKLTAAIMNYGLISTLKHFGGPWTLDSTWRFALAFGCSLNVLTLYFRWQLHESAIYSNLKKKEIGVDGDKLVVDDDEVEVAAKKEAAAAAAADPTNGAVVVSPLAGASAPVAHEPHHKHHKHVAALDLKTTLSVIWEYKWTLLGTAGSWFLIDVTFYGQSLMNTTVVYSAVADSSGMDPINKLRTSLLGTVWVMLIALPGYFFAIATIERIGRWNMQQMGFLMSAICFSILAAAYHTPLRESANGAGFVIFYGLTYFFANFGPNSTTFLMPAEAFPTRCRSTGHGFSAAMGKLGATAGSFGLLDMYNRYCTSSLDSAGLPNCGLANTLKSESDTGIVAVMAVCVAVSLGGNIITTFFTKETGGRTLEEVDAGSKVLAAHDAEITAKYRAEHGGSNRHITITPTPDMEESGKTPIVDGAEGVTDPANKVQPHDSTDSSSTASGPVSQSPALELRVPDATESQPPAPAV